MDFKDCKTKPANSRDLTNVSGMEASRSKVCSAVKGSFTESFMGRFEKTTSSLNLASKPAFPLVDQRGHRFWTKVSCSPLSSVASGLQPVSV